MDFSSIVIMEKNDNVLTNELGSYKVDDGAEYITKVFSVNGIVHIYFDTSKDVEDWEYSAIYDNFNEDIFKENDFDIEFEDNEYNPTWLVKFPFIEDHQEMELKVVNLCKLINDEMNEVVEVVEDKKEDYDEDLNKEV